MFEHEGNMEKIIADGKEMIAALHKNSDYSQAAIRLATRSYCAGMTMFLRGNKKNTQEEIKAV